jgi:hypothetical protein
MSTVGSIHSFGDQPARYQNSNFLKRMIHLTAISQRNDVDQKTLGGITDVRFCCTTKRIIKKGTHYANRDRNIEYDTNDLDSRFA